jgi:hypothetical protein
MSELVELTEPLPASPYLNRDRAPWFSASLVSFILYSYLMRPARGGRGEGEA